MVTGTREQGLQRERERKREGGMNRNRTEKQKQVAYVGLVEKRGELRVNLFVVLPLSGPLHHT